MSWLNKELPVDWPSKNTDHSESSGDFSTSQSGDSINVVDPTVAIQPNADTEQPLWKQAIQAPQQENRENSHRLTQLFVPPTIPSNPNENPSDIKDEDMKGPRNQQDDTQEDHNGNDTNGNLNSTSTEGSTFRSSSSQNDGTSEEPKRPINRRLKVFGRPDTYTNERLGNLLSSMGGANGHNSTSNLNHNSSSVNGFGEKSTVDMSGNESDVDIANNLQNEGRKVLQGLAPFRPNLSAVQESSLDELEQQLTSQGTAPRIQEDRLQDADPPAFETTSSTVSKHDTSSQTLESLPAGLSNWDTIGGPFHGRQDNNANTNGDVDRSSLFVDPPLLKRHSSQTLVGSNRSGKERYPAAGNHQSYRDAEAEISALGIHEPVNVANGQETDQEADVSPANLSARNSIQNFSNEFTTSSEQPTTTSAESFRQQQQQQQALQLQQQQQQQQEQVWDSQRSHDQHPWEQQHQLPNRPRPRESRIRFAQDELVDETPDHLARRFLKFKTPQRQSRYQRSSSSGTGDVDNSIGVADSPLLEHSIAAKDISFSAGYQWLAQLIRERNGNLQSASLESLDSLDLSNCELESIVGLDQFVPKLTTLFLNDNFVRSLQGLPFNLVHLDMSSNKLSNMNTFPTCFVSTLILSNNELETLEPLANLRALSSLDVSNNKLKSLKGIENLTALRTLNLRNNQLTSLNINLGMLVELDAAHNEISAVKLNAPNLESLDLEGNEVVALSEPLPNLRELNIRFNGATVDFKGWQSLETVLFDGNNAVRNLESVAGILVTFSWEQPRAESRNYGNGKYRDVPTHLLTNSRDVKLSGRSVGWPFTRTSSIFSAQHLDISLCNIRELPDNFSKTFPFLRSLNLAFNKLDSRCIPILAQCKSLERLSLFGNRLDITGEKLARKLPHLRVIDSRSQNRARKLVAIGEYSSEVYSAITEIDSANPGSIVNTKSSELQWIDAKWTNHAANIKQTTRPGFPSPLYPESWNPPSSSDIRSAVGTSTEEETTMIGALNAWDMVEAMYVHHFIQSRGEITSTNSR